MVIMILSNFKIYIVIVFIFLLTGCYTNSPNIEYQILLSRLKQLEQNSKFNEEDSLNYITIWITVSNGSEYPITIKQVEKNKFLGPRGEYYSEVPSKQQLSVLYGF